MERILLARQPIFDRNLDVVAYELLFRRADAAPTDILDGDHATSQIIRHTFMDGAADRIVGAHPAHINLTANLIQQGVADLLPRERVVLELDDHEHLDTEAILLLQELADQGYRVALDNFSWRPELVPLLDFVSMVKLDVLALSWDEIERQLELLMSFPVDLLASKVESHADFQRCVEAGFHQFQGYFLCRPDLVRGRTMPTARLTLMQLLRKVYDPNVTIAQLEALIRRDVSLSYRLLRIINSAYYSLPRKVHSIHEALVLLGLKFVRQWVTVLSMGGSEDKPPELFNLAMIRAHMCQTLGKAAGARDGEPFFVVGLFSVLDAAMDRPLPVILQDLPLSEDVMAALLHREGPLGEALDCVLAHEQGHWHRVRFRNLPTEAIQEAYVRAVSWATQAQTLVKDRTR